MNPERRLYLELMKKCLTNTIYGDSEMSPVSDSSFAKRLVLSFLRSKGLLLVRRGSYVPEYRDQGIDWPPYAHTMIGVQRLNNVQYCTEQVLKEGVPGDLIETGVWRGGATILMRAVLKAYGIHDRCVWVADSFEGLPVPDAARFPEDKGDLHFTEARLAVPLEEVKKNFAAYDLLDDQVRFLKGWFSETLRSAEIGQLALIRLDGDMYQSTMDAITNLYPKLSVGGYLIVDDWGAVLACRRAIEDYRAKHGITEAICPIDGKGIYWKKGR